MEKLIIEVLLEYSGNNIRVIDVTRSSSICDNYIIASFNNERLLSAVAEEINIKLKQNNYLPNKIEGKGTRWVVVDLGDTILHLFHDDEREIYKLEKLWDKFPIKEIN